MKNIKETVEQLEETVKIKIDKRIVIVLVVGVVVAVAGFFLYNSFTGPATTPVSYSGYVTTSPLIGQEVPIEGRTHVPEGTKVEYKNSNPPTSGNHWSQPAEWGFYNEPLPDEILVHNLEHGGIWVSHKNVDDETKSKLKALAEKYPQAVIITPRPENDAKISVASWGRLLKMEKFDEEIVERFIKSNLNKAPESLASLEQIVVKVSASFPNFDVTEVDGRKITKDSLQGKPAIIWFTTSWCVPCQIGAREVSKLDNELGGDAFNVLVIFVDPRESNEDLINWRRKFANEDWMVAFDNELTNLAARVDLRFLDSKFLLDSNGIIKNIDFRIADENYLNTIRNVVQVG